MVVLIKYLVRTILVGQVASGPVLIVYVLGSMDMMKTPQTRTGILLWIPSMGNATYVREKILTYRVGTVLSATAK